MLSWIDELEDTMNEKYTRELEKKLAEISNIVYMSWDFEEDGYLIAEEDARKILNIIGE